MAGDGEDDLFRRRKVPFPLNISNTKSSMSPLSSHQSLTTTAEDARLLSKANDQAAIAARSILMSGGTEQTAVKTARAAAEAVLQSYYDSNSVTIGPKEWFVKRKIKKQAEVVGSMALVTAANSVKGINIEKSDMVTTSSSTVPDAFVAKQSDSVVSKPKLSLKERILGSKKVHSSMNDQASKNSDKSSKRSFFSRKSKASKDDQSTMPTVAIHVENSRDGANSHSSKQSSKRRSHDSLLLLGSENEEHIYTINKQRHSKEASSSADGCFIANLENVISSESGDDFLGQDSRSTFLGQDSRSTLHQTAATGNVPASKNGTCAASPFEIFACFGGRKQEAGLIPEQDESAANSFSVKSEIIEQHHSDWLDNRSSSDLDYKDAALSSDGDRSTGGRRERQGRDDPNNAYESRDEEDQSTSSSASSASSSSSESLETTYSELKHRLRSKRRERDVAIQSVYLDL